MTRSRRLHFHPLLFSLLIFVMGSITDYDSRLPLVGCAHPCSSSTLLRQSFPWTFLLRSFSSSHCLLPKFPACLARSVEMQSSLPTLGSNAAPTVIFLSFHSMPDVSLRLKSNPKLYFFFSRCLTSCWCSKTARKRRTGTEVVCWQADQGESSRRQQVADVGHRHLLPPSMLRSSNPAYGYAQCLYEIERMGEEGGAKAIAGGGKVPPTLHGCFL